MFPSADITNSLGLNPEIVILGMIFLAAALGVFGVVSLFPANREAKRRLDARSGISVDRGGPSIRYDGGQTGFDALLNPIRRYAIPSDEKAQSSTRLKLMSAGYRSPSAVATFFASRILLGLVGLGAASASILPLAQLNLDPTMKLAMILGGAGLGFLLPSVWIGRKTAMRKTSFRNGFPDALDLLLVCVEAGLGLDAAISRVSEELAESHPVIADEFNLLANELRAGKARERALLDLADRVDLDEIRSFVALMVQSSRIGSSLGDSLRVAADEMRHDRLMRAEEQAAKLPVKLSVPLVLFLLPALIIAIMLPAGIMIVRILMPAMAS